MNKIPQYFLLFILTFGAGSVGCSTSSIGKPPSDQVRKMSFSNGRYEIYHKSSFSEKKTRTKLNKVIGTGNQQKISVRNKRRNDPNPIDSTESPRTLKTTTSPDFEDFDEYDVDEKKEIDDPLEGYNRFMFTVNDRFYEFILKPLSTGWKTITPEFLRLAVDNFFMNLLFPMRFVNSLLQFKIEGAARELARFVVNTTAGVGGLWDPGKKIFDLEPSKEDFGQTLAVWGFGPGFPLVLPFWGQSNLRDAIGMIPDFYLDPLTYIDDTLTQVGIRFFKVINETSLYILGVYDNQKEQAMDPYTFFRNLYRQNRKSKIQK